MQRKAVLVIAFFIVIKTCEKRQKKSLRKEDKYETSKYFIEILFTDKAINKKASVLFGYKQHEEVLCGDVLVQKDIETPEGIIAVGFNEEEATVIEAYIENLKYEHIKFIKQEPCAKFIPF